MEKFAILYRRNGKKVYIKQPELKELAFSSKMWADEKTMEDIGGVFSFPESKWETFYRNMVTNEDNKNFYCLVYEATTDEPVGEVSIHGYDSATKSARFNIKILYKYRRKGYGEEGLKLLLEYYFLEFGGNILLDNIINEPALNLVKKLGFEITGQYKDEIGVRLTKNSFSNTSEIKKKDVVILSYNNMDILDYSLAFNLLSAANEHANEKIFNISTLSFENNIKTNYGLNIVGEKQIKSGDILILPGGIKDCSENKETIEYIKNNFNKWDYICVCNEAIELLIKSNAIDGIFIPEGQINEGNIMCVKERNVINKDFVDNGKVILSSNLVGEIKMILRLIDKVGGKSLVEKVKKTIGFLAE